MTYTLSLFANTVEAGLYYRSSTCGQSYKESNFHFTGNEKSFKTMLPPSDFPWKHLFKLTGLSMKVNKRYGLFRQNLKF